MKASIKLAVLGALALVGGVANAAVVNTGSAAATGSSLVLLLKNYSDTEYAAFELSPKVFDLKSQSALLADVPSFYSIDDSGTTGSLNVPGALNGYTNANLTAYLSDASNIGDNIVWTIMGSATGDGTGGAAQGVIALTSTVDHLQAYWDNSSANTSAQAFSSFIVGELNGPGSGFVNGVSATSGWDSTNPLGTLADISFNGAGKENGATLGTAQSLYLMSTVGDAGFAANTYKSQYTLTLSAAGLLSYNAPTSTVPVPAAIWLLGSGLMGLVGIGRRRNAAVVAA